jgi:predicted MFS family arabinose efflux permease
MSLYPFPVNYSVIFYAAGGLLLIASGGFWILREKPPNSGQKTPHIFGKGANLLTILRNDPNFFSYVLLNNIVSIAIAIIPFYIALAKIRFRLTPRDVGNYLLFQILGMILSNILWMKIIKKTNTYKSILYLYLLLGMFLPGYALAAAESQELYLSIFFLSGFALTAHEVVMSGILVEISTDENRALYTGISGTGNILSAIFPMIGGVFIAKIGYPIVFLCASLFICFGVVFAKRIHCQPEYSPIQ